MKITLKETITKEVELVLPCWRKSKSAYYYITEEFHVEITNLDGWVTIETWATKPPLSPLSEVFNVSESNLDAMVKIRRLENEINKLKAQMNSSKDSTL